MSATQTTTPTPSPVIDFASESRKRFDNTTKKPEGVRGSGWHPDGALIIKCLELAVDIKAGEALYMIDPTDGEFANLADTRHRNRADRALAYITAFRPTTLDGLKAKARLVDLVLVDIHAIDGIELDFLKSAASDVCRFHDALTNHASGMTMVAAP